MSARETGDEAKAEQVQDARDILGREVLTAHAPVTPLAGRLVELRSPGLCTTLRLSRAHRQECSALGLAFLAGLLLARRMVVPIRALHAGAARIDQLAI